ncbi:MAG: hypothetical protein KF742_00370 [Cryobacterium sp.]|nr:hypothetical protein [Cryobacterium sp.]MCO5293778.1 hypothetical protein [Homoserinimonas sp.]MCW5945190.1 hypothetical protein [Cryobacterium sp.]
MKELDYSPLNSSVTAEQIRQFKRAHSSSQSGELIFRLIIGTFILAIIGLAASILFEVEFSNPALILILLLVAGGIFVVLSLVRSRGQWERWIRMSRFALDNDLVFETETAPPGYAGMIFSIGENRAIQERISRLDDPFVDIAQYRYTTGSGKNKRTHHWTYLALKLDRRLPQMVLDSKLNNTILSNLPAIFTRSQVLELEGDFNSKFKLYCPKEYETDALYIFTPDLMSALMDKAAALDVEVVDDWIFFYANGQLDLSTPEVLSQFFKIVQTVGKKVISQSARYADSRLQSPAEARSGLNSRLAADMIAPQGRRLKRGISWAAVSLMVGIFLLWLLIGHFGFGLFS